MADLEEVEVPFLGEIYSREADFWTAIVKVDGHETHLDTGAAVSVVSDKEPRPPPNEIAADFKRSRRYYSISRGHLSSHSDI